MHPSALDNMQKCYWRYVVGSEYEIRESVKVLDISSGAFKDIFGFDNIHYTEVDFASQETWTFKGRCFDIIVSAEVPVEAVWPEMQRLLTDDGLAFLITSTPQDYKTLARQMQCHVIEAWQDKRGPQYDCVAVLSKSPKPRTPNLAIDNTGPEAVLMGAPKAATPYEKIQGDVPYLETLEFLHRVMEPRNYLEIGIRHGKSLALAKCPAVGVDPMPEIKHELSAMTRIVQIPSDAFFESRDEILSAKPDLVFIDGMHLFEYALRDFMHVEAISGPDTIVVIDDILPNMVQQAYRDRETIYWTGDVWKLYAALKKYRPDLSLILLDTRPTGLLLITGLDSKNTILWDQYNTIVEEAMVQWGEAGDDILNRMEAVSPASKPFKQALQVIKAARQNGVALSTKTARIKEILNAG